jgi:hypothetical protein
VLDHNTQVINSSTADIDQIFQLFDYAIQYQKTKGYELWPQFERSLIENEIAEKRHWKIIQNNEVVAIFSVIYNDPVIWIERDADPAVYLHRIAIHPLFKGKNMMKMIIRPWVISHAKEKKKRFVRMDTWGNNVNLREYYISCGFNYIGQQYLKQTEGMPAHYGGDVLSLFEIEV